MGAWGVGEALLDACLFALLFRHGQSRLKGEQLACGRVVGYLQEVDSVACGVGVEAAPVHHGWKQLSLLEEEAVGFLVEVWMEEVAFVARSVKGLDYLTIYYLTICTPAPAA